MWLITSALRLGFACVANSHLHLPPTVRSDLAVRRMVFLLHARILLEMAHLHRSSELVRGIGDRLFEGDRTRRRRSTRTRCPNSSSVAQHCASSGSEL